jgi:hypothetical protein
MAARPECMLATVDARQARLFRCTHAAPNNWPIEEIEALRNSWQAGHERPRPSILGRGPGSTPPHEASRARGAA